MWLGRCPESNYFFATFAQTSCDTYEAALLFLCILFCRSFGESPGKWRFFTQQGGVYRAAPGHQGELPVALSQRYTALFTGRCGELCLAVGVRQHAAYAFG